MYMQQLFSVSVWKPIIFLKNVETSSENSVSKLNLRLSFFGWFQPKKVLGMMPDSKLSRQWQIRPGVS